jgi:hypothetical protein
VRIGFFAVPAEGGVVFVVIFSMRGIAEVKKSEMQK